MTLKQSPYPVVMARLIALDMPASKTFVELVQRVWSNGDAVLPIDQRLPQHGKKLLLDAMICVPTPIKSTQTFSLDPLTVRS